METFVETHSADALRILCVPGAPVIALCRQNAQGVRTSDF